MSRRVGTIGVGLAGNPAIAHLSGVNTLGGGDPAWDIRSKLDTQFGAGAFDAAVQRALDTWAAAADLEFVQLADSGGPFALAGLLAGLGARALRRAGLLRPR
jgi:hypothetical protein